MGNLSRIVVAALVLAALSFPKAASAEEQITLNFKDAEINAVINTVADLTGQTFIIDPRVKGKVNVVSSQPLRKDEVVGVFLSIMEVHGFATVPIGKAIKIIPNSQVRNTPQRVLDNVTGAGAGDEVITHVLPLQYVSAQELAPILRPLMSNNGHLADYAPSNSLIFSDNAANIQRMLDIVKRVDKNSEREIEVIPLQYALGTEIVRLLDKLWPQNTTDAASRISVGVDERSNSILLSGNSGNRLEIRTLISHLDTPVESGGDTQVIYLRYANAENVARILTGLNSASTETGAAADDKSQIQADIESNALVITAPPSRFKSLRAVIQKLDMPRAQVHIEAIIAEVSFNTAKELGVEWVVDGSQGDSNTYPIGGTNFPNNGGTLAGIAGSILTGTIPVFGSGLSVGVGGTTDGGRRFGALLRALATDSSTNILSTPSLTTLDNQEAEIIVGQNVPFKTGSYTTEGSIGQLNPFTTIKREDVGITLKVKPQINEGDAITMSIEQDISSVSANSASETDLTTNKRSIKTTVLVANDDMIVLGGLIDEDVQESQSKVPVLGSIPLLGRLFRFDKTTKLKRTLMVFIHPKIISSPSMGHSISQSKYLYLQNEQNKLGDKESIEVAPELADFPPPPADPEPQQDDAEPEVDPGQ